MKPELKPLLQLKPECLILQLKLAFGRFTNMDFLTYVTKRSYSQFKVVCVCVCEVPLSPGSREGERNDLEKQFLS